MSTVLLLAGRRPAPKTPMRCGFRSRTLSSFASESAPSSPRGDPARLIRSAACGADLLALDIAGEFGVERHVVLPFAVQAFRASSVTDRPGEWGIYSTASSEK